MLLKLVYIRILYSKIKYLIRNHQNQLFFLNAEIWCSQRIDALSAGISIKMILNAKRIWFRQLFTWGACFQNARHVLDKFLISLVILAKTNNVLSKKQAYFQRKGTCSRELCPNLISKPNTLYYISLMVYQYYFNSVIYDIDWWCIGLIWNILFPNMIDHLTRYF